MAYQSNAFGDPYGGSPSDAFGAPGMNNQQGNGGYYGGDPTAFGSPSQANQVIPSFEAAVVNGGVSSNLSGDDGSEDSSSEDSSSDSSFDDEEPNQQGMYNPQQGNMNGSGYQAPRQVQQPEPLWEGESVAEPKKKKGLFGRLPFFKKKNQNTSSVPQNQPQQGYEQNYNPDPIEYQNTNQYQQPMAQNGPIYDQFQENPLSMGTNSVNPFGTANDPQPTSINVSAMNITGRPSFESNFSGMNPSDGLQPNQGLPPGLGYTPNNKPAAVDSEPVPALPPRKKNATLMGDMTNSMPKKDSRYDTKQVADLLMPSTQSMKLGVDALFKQPSSMGATSFDNQLSAKAEKVGTVRDKMGKMSVKASSKQANAIANEATEFFKLKESRSQLAGKDGKIAPVSSKKKPAGTIRTDGTVRGADGKGVDPEKRRKKKKKKKKHKKKRREGEVVRKRSKSKDGLSNPKTHGTTRHKHKNGKDSGKTYRKKSKTSISKPPNAQKSSQPAPSATSSYATRRAKPPAYDQGTTAKVMNLEKVESMIRGMEESIQNPEIGDAQREQLKNMIAKLKQKRTNLQLSAGLELLEELE